MRTGSDTAGVRRDKVTAWILFPSLCVYVYSVHPPSRPTFKWNFPQHCIQIRLKRETERESELVTATELYIYDAKGNRERNIYRKSCIYETRFRSFILLCVRDHLKSNCNLCIHFKEDSKAHVETIRALPRINPRVIHRSVM